MPGSLCRWPFAALLLWAAAAAAVVVAYTWLRPVGLGQADPAPAPMVGLPLPDAPGVVDVTLHEPQELRLLLQGLDQLALPSSDEPDLPPVALVLHGPEVRFFASGHYREYQDIVDLAARLDAFGVIEVKMCRTQMRSLGIAEDEVPAFVEVVPFGPAEVGQLLDRGYLRM